VEIRGSTALVTGGSRGLGGALGRELARRGARVVLIARSREELEALVRGIRAGGGEAHGLVGDVGREEDAARLAGEAAALSGPPDILVHAASTLGRTPLEALVDTAPADFERVLQVNLLGPFRLTLAVAGSMLVRRRGLVVAVSSDAAVVPYPRWGAYGVSKAALDHLLRIWAAELAGTGVRFVSVDPGEMDTEMHAAALPGADRAALADPADVAARIAAIVQASESVASGSRVEAGAWPGAA
jgi:NAD(P)-dependent dehydrogenase (short-subunit alcohol dehydrogenase family)